LIEIKLIQTKILAKIPHSNLNFGLKSKCITIIKLIINNTLTIHLAHLTTNQHRIDQIMGLKIRANS
jgi:hypothetical protein